MTIQNNRLNGINPLAYLGVNATQPPQVITATIDPTVADNKGFPVLTLWYNSTSKTVFIYLGNDQNGDAEWKIFAGPFGDVLTISDTSGTKVHPDNTGNIQINAAPMTGVTVTADVPPDTAITIAGVNVIEPTGQTTDATPLALQSLLIPTNSAYAFQALVHGVKSDFSNAASFTIMRGIRRGAGAPVLIGGTVQQLCSDAPVGVTADVTLNGNNAEITVTGLAATTYNWAATIKWVQII